MTLLLLLRPVNHSNQLLKRKKLAVKSGADATPKVLALPVAQFHSEL
jgi:hypothetical protein